MALSRRIARVNCPQPSTAELSVALWLDFSVRSGDNRALGGRETRPYALAWGGGIDLLGGCKTRPYVLTWGSGNGALGGRETRPYALA